tara:strand:- start:609 stop:767 length:159 start_codon:yes stop_codon:yes gene_type:complete
MKTLFLPLVDWGMGTFIIGVFAVVCIVMVAVVYSLSRGSKANNDSNDNEIGN